MEPFSTKYFKFQDKRGPNSNFLHEFSRTQLRHSEVIDIKHWISSIFESKHQNGRPSNIQKHTSKLSVTYNLRNKNMYIAGEFIVIHALLPSPFPMSMQVGHDLFKVL